MQAIEEASTTARASLKYLVADHSVLVDGFIAAPKASVVIDLDHLREALAQHGLGIVSLTKLSSGSAVRSEVQEPSSLHPVLLLQSSGESEQPEELPTDAACQLTAPLGQESHSSDLLLIEERGLEMSSPRPKVAMKKEAGKGRAKQARQAGAKPRGQVSRKRPVRASTRGPTTTSGKIQAITVQPETSLCFPKAKKSKLAQVKEEQPGMDADAGVQITIGAPKGPSVLPPNDAGAPIAAEVEAERLLEDAVAEQGSGAAVPAEAAPAPKAKAKKRKEGSGAAVPAEAAPAPKAKAKKRKAVNGAPEEPKAKASAAKKAKIGTDLVEKPMPSADFQAAVGALAEVQANVEYIYAPGQEPYRKLGLKVYEKPQASVAECKLVLNTQDLYWKYYIEAKRTEQARYDAGGGRNPDGTKMSRRPDTKARTRMEVEGKNCNAEKRAGYVPGHQLNQRYFARSEIGTLGLHFLPLGGIQTATKQDLPKGCPMFALSVMSSGCYEDDADDGDVMTMTGEGGNDLLGNKRQVGHQKLKAGNLALVGNIQLGIPVRMIRKNVAKGSEFGYIYIFDGLYNVVRYWTERGASGFLVYRYELRRRSGQGELCSKALVFGGGCAPKDFAADSRKKEVRFLFSEDVSGGKEAVPVVGVNEWDEDVLTIGHSGDSAQNLPLVRDDLGCPGLQRYVIKDERLPGIPEPKALEVPKEFKDDPHEFIAHLNSGALPYQLAGDGKTGILARTPMAMVYECGPWTGCKDGLKWLPMEAAGFKMLDGVRAAGNINPAGACMTGFCGLGCPWRLEVFKTRGRGWGVRSWDTIPFGAYVTSFRGLIRPHAEHEEDDTFVFNLDKRSDMSWDSQFLDEPERQRDVKYALDGTRIGNVGRYINHSCNPNCFVQPVLSEHGDREMPSICFFAMRNIPPMEELAYDYGASYIEARLGGRCHCGDAVCTFAGAPSSSTRGSTWDA